MSSFAQWLLEWMEWASYENRSNRTLLQSVVASAVLYAPSALIFATLLSDYLEMTVLKTWLVFEIFNMLFYGLLGWDYYVFGYQEFIYRSWYEQCSDRILMQFIVDIVIFAALHMPITFIGAILLHNYMETTIPIAWLYFEVSITLIWALFSCYINMFINKFAQWITKLCFGNDNEDNLSIELITAIILLKRQTQIVKSQYESLRAMKS